MIKNLRTTIFRSRIKFITRHLQGAGPYLFIRSPPSGHAPKPGLIALIMPLRPHCSRTLRYSGVPRTPNLLKISTNIESDLEKAFSTHYTSIWKLNRISTTNFSKVAQKCIWCCSRVQRCVTATELAGECSPYVSSKESSRFPMSSWRQRTEKPRKNTLHF